MPVTLEPMLPHIPAFLMVLFRISGIFLLMPMFGSSTIPARVKAFLALALAACVYPAVPLQPSIDLTMANVGLRIGSELLIGFMIGYGVTLPLVAIQMAGQLMGQQLGLAIARVLNPDLDSQTSVMGEALFLLALTIFIILDGHHAMLHTLIHSFQRIPLGGYIPDGQILPVMTGLLATVFELAIRVAAPLLCLIFLETVAMGFVARTVPNLNILSLGFPLRIMIGFMIMLPILVVMRDPLIESFRHTIDRLYELIDGFVV